MSGICAVWRKDTPETGARALDALCAGLSLESQERREVTLDGAVGIGVSARFETQQICRDPLVAVACEADIYNFAELREFLPDIAEPAEPNGTAVLFAQLYARFGIRFIEKLRGDFAIVVWDRRKGDLYAAVDGFGIHTLVYYEDSRNLLIASRIDALLATGEVPRKIDPRGIAKYLNYTVNLAPDSIFANVRRLLPGQFLCASGGRVRQIEQYWDMRYLSSGASEGELSRKLESVVEQSVRAHCNADSFDGIGAFLSGGTDSSTVVGMMSRLQRGPVNTFSIGFEEQRFNELEYARITARKFEASHHEYLVNAGDCTEAIPEMVRYFDEPFGNSSAIPTYFCARLAAQHGVQVLLAGDGGDELFGGNERYLTDTVFDAYQNVPRFLRKRLAEPLLAKIPFNGLFSRARSYIRRSNLPQPERFFSYNLLLDNPLGNIFEGDFVESLGDYSVLERPVHYYREGPAQDHLNRLLYLDVKITLGDNDLLKVTRMCELAGIRARFPFLDREVADYSGTIPSSLMVKGTEKRYLFRKAFRELLPPEVLAKKKHGFGIPVSVWMKSDRRMREMTRDILLSPRTYERGFIRRGFVEDLIQRHDADETAFYGDTVWTFLALELWFRQFVDQPKMAAA
jgi:asparagine synthase (glutamine-hydrolysing)